MSPPYPWQQALWQHLTSLSLQKKLPHAILLTGGSGLGKQDFADSFAKYLLCQSPTQNQPCHTCRACCLVEANTHPDWVLVKPEKPQSPITISQVRDLQPFVSKTAHHGGFKWICFDKAERLNTAASNALLKILEEPPLQTVITLVTAHPHRLLATIKSRCQTFPLKPPLEAEAMAWLQAQCADNKEDVHHASMSATLRLAGYAPLQALELLKAENLALQKQVTQDLWGTLKDPMPLKVADGWIKNQPEQALYYMCRLLTDMVALREGIDVPTAFDEIINMDKQRIQRVSPKSLFGLLDKTLAARQSFQLEGGRNAQLMLGSLLIDWQNLFLEETYGEYGRV